MAPHCFCSFCDKSGDDVPAMVSHEPGPPRPPVYICSECIALCVQIMVGNLRPKGQPDLIAKLNKWQREGA